MENDTNGKRIVNSIVLVMGVIILILMSALIVGSLVNSSAFQTTLSGTETNETLSALNATVAQTFDVIGTYPNAVCSLTSVVNATDATVVPATNYTFTADGCTLILVALSPYIGEDVNTTYSYTSAQNSIGGINTTWVGIQFGLFVTALLGFLAVIGVIIAIVWLISYIKPLFSKDGLESFAGN
jgi:hypothetical protein